MEQTGRRSTAASCFFHAQSPYFAVPHRRAGRLAAALLVGADAPGRLLLPLRGNSPSAHIGPSASDGSALSVTLHLFATRSLFPAPPEMPPDFARPVFRPARLTVPLLTTAPRFLSRCAPSATGNCSSLRKKHLAPAAQLLFRLRVSLFPCSRALRASV